MTKIQQTLIALTLALFAPLGFAAPIEGGVTDVRLDEPVAEAIIGAGVSPAPLGSAGFEADSLTFSFPITGGDLSDEVIPGSLIDHDGSGISFTAGDISIEIGNFQIDTTTLLISGFARSTNPASGDALDIDAGVPLFSLSTGSEVDGFPFIVSLTDTAAGALNATFNTDLFSAGQRIGTAATGPVVSEVPEPGTLGLLGLGLLAMSRLRSRRA